MGNPDGGGGLIDMLSACAAGTVGIDSQIVQIDLHVQILLDIRHHIAGYERRLPLSGRVEGGNSYQTVDASL